MVTLQILPAVGQPASSERHLFFEKRILWGVGCLLGIGLFAILLMSNTKRHATIPLTQPKIRVVAINQGWNPPFVVVNIGAQDGVTIGSKMVVMRGNSRVYKISITSVEPSVSVADVIPQSLTPGLQITIGDRVMLDK